MKKGSKVLTLVLAASIACTATLAGCDLVSTDSQANMNQIIAEVDITDSDEELLTEDGLDEYTDAITEASGITKRELVVMFLNSGASLVSDGTTTYGEAFETIAETLIQNEILIQYATLETLKNMTVSNYDDLTTAESVVNKYLSFEEDSERYEWLLEYQAKVDSYENNEEINYVMLVKYNLYTSINSSIDNYERQILDEDDTTDSSSATLPTGVDTEVENYYPKVNDDPETLNYNVYTGFDGYTRGLSGEYKEDQIEGTTQYTRMKAYNDFLGMLNTNYMIADDDDVQDVLSLTYVQSLYLMLLRQQFLTNYLELYVENVLESSISGDDYSYLQKRYDELLAQQKATYDASTSDFETAMSSVSDTSFILYTPETDDDESKFGFVYNILVPFSEQQNILLDEYADRLGNDVYNDSQYYVFRNQLLSEIRTTDQRTSWFNGGIDYSFDATETILTDEYYGKDYGRTILFFEDNLINSNGRYEEIEKYTGLYSYNGIAYLNDDEETYTVIPNELTIDDVLYEFENYIEFVLNDGDSDSDSDSVIWYYCDGLDDDGVLKASASGGNEEYYERTDFTFTADGSDDEEEDSNDEDEIDYSKLIYAYGTVDLSDSSYAELLNRESDAYKALSAVNELQYAYTTDTSVLSEYIGYTVSAYDTDYIEEFEYAAQYAINNGGAGSFIVCAGDYGWHIIYVTAVLEPGKESYDPDWDDRVDKEGTFENLFYEYVKTELENGSSNQQTNILYRYYKEDVTVTIYEERFEDLTSLTTTTSDSSSSDSSSTTAVTTTTTSTSSSGDDD